MADERRLPELARSLRSLGAPGEPASEAAHDAIFAPLLDARARAAGATTDIMLAALRGDALSARIEALAVDAAVRWVEQPAMVRAVTAQTSEIMEPLRDDLLALDQAATTARDDDAGWNGWVAQLRKVFATADVACQALARLIAEHTPANAERVERRQKKR
ncbi:MAG: hypothetical protein JWM95_4719 [Gemmatimonadetes bacterium]|nr:hypothetical protein [Gemmatimonadota bacterium]